MIPFSTLSEKADFIARLSIVLGVILTLFFLNVIAVPIPLLASMDLPFVLIAIYYWTIHRPTLMPPAFVFIIGLALDMLTANILGLNALIFTLCHALITNQRSFLLAQPFFAQWVGFALISALAMLLGWGMNALANWTWISPFMQIQDYGIGVLILPLIVFVLHLSHRMLPAPKMPLTAQRKTSKSY